MQRFAQTFPWIAALLLGGSMAVAAAADSPNAEEDGGKPVSAADSTLSTPDRAGSNGSDGQPGVDDEAEKAAQHARRVDKLFTFLGREYGKLLRSRDWITRSVAVVSLSRMSSDNVTKKLIEQLQGERHPVAKVVAWQAMLSRASMLTVKEAEIWEEQTLEMMRANVFHGDLRIGLLEFLSHRPLSRASKRYVSDLLENTNSLDSVDVPTLIALGHALPRWGDASLVEDVLAGLRNPDSALRAELILQAAGFDVPWQMDRGAYRVYRDWWKNNKKAFTEVEMSPLAFRRLQPQFLPAVLKPEDVDPRAKHWLDELELERLSLSRFDFAVAIDRSGSMRAEMERLKRELQVMMKALQLVSSEPRIGVTTFTGATDNTVATHPLTDSTQPLIDFINSVQIAGGGEEQWTDALKQTIEASQWAPPSAFSRRVIVLMSDEAMSNRQLDVARSVAEQAEAAGFNFYMVKVQQANVPNNPLSKPLDRTGRDVSDQRPSRDTVSNKSDSQGGPANWFNFDRVAELTGGSAFDSWVLQGPLGLGIPMTDEKEALKIAPVYPGGGPTVQVLTTVLVDAIHPGYAQHVEPFARVLVNYCQQYREVQVEQRSGFGRAPKPKMEPNHED